MVRTVGATGVEVASRVLARAFRGEPYPRHVLPAESYDLRLRSLYRHVVEVGVGSGRAEVDELVRGVAVWVDSDRLPSISVEQAKSIYGLRFERAADCAERIARLRPPGEQVVLETLGVDPEHRGLGVARRLLESGLARADSRSLPVYLETARIENVRMYEKFGFAVGRVIELPEGGPSIWTMLRSPAGA